MTFIDDIVAGVLAALDRPSGDDTKTPPHPLALQSWQQQLRAVAVFYRDHRTKWPVRGASVWQVRQPIYRSSLERWRAYEKHLEPLKKSLGIS